MDGSSNLLKSNITIVLVGHTGNGKSATGNSILGRRGFKSMASASSVTSTCELQTKSFPDGPTINVIDTHGFGDTCAQLELQIEEVTKCFQLAENEIHAILLVVSVRSRFSIEEAAAIRNLQTILGHNVVNYVIVVFTGGDELDEKQWTLDDYLGHDDCPDPLKEIIRLCGNRCILFDNRTKIEVKKQEQVNELLKHVQKVIIHNGGVPFKHKLYEAKKKSQHLWNKLKKIYNLNEGNPQRSSVSITEQANQSYHEENKEEAVSSNKGEQNLMRVDRKRDKDIMTNKDWNKSQKDSKPSWPRAFRGS